MHVCMYIQQICNAHAHTRARGHTHTHTYTCTYSHTHTHAYAHDQGIDGDYYATGTYGADN